VAMWSDPQSRLDLHNININFAAASRGRCGFSHLDSGRVCQLTHTVVGWPQTCLSETSERWLKGVSLVRAAPPRVGKPAHGP
jgi:hypothetical protein